jgi:hypothetical protein
MRVIEENPTGKEAWFYSSESKTKYSSVLSLILTIQAFSSHYFYSLRLHEGE